MTRLLRAHVTWLAANLVLGYCATFPLLAGVLLEEYGEAEILGDQAAPFHYEEAALTLCFFVVGIAFVTTVFAVANRRLRRSLASWHPAAFWLVSIALQIVPFIWFMWGTDRSFWALLGRGVLW
jgi:uncharacterized membrane protein YhaH (DUF805 family)